MDHLPPSRSLWQGEKSIGSFVQPPRRVFPICRYTHSWLLNPALSKSISTMSLHLNVDLHVLLVPPSSVPLLPFSPTPFHPLQSAPKQPNNHYCLSFITISILNSPASLISVHTHYEDIHTLVIEHYFKIAMIKRIRLDLSRRCSVFFPFRNLLRL